MKWMEFPLFFSFVVAIHFYLLGDYLSSIFNRYEVIRLYYTLWNFLFPFNKENVILDSHCISPS